ncbi:MAG: Rieske (2Fe-2S) protein [Ignavibacteriaceae bacterium]|jgi:Ferredoxin subunits of nitrite reductase and ring-hydroxylating dioxygenases|nr:MAG: Rieske (2Fe-2S) protein [Chlorobiota bacterium]KXK05791.1 MAG: Cytochrome b6-f complex iron-sulfur subunit [Chlorobi bacterium OLB4]MBV6398378.1 Cytochrome b6-f complex iron-sulfur subunit [Ignavibacteria bacterium]MCC6886031.1 Rieske (2Fe-2S) protein [Ignavibacteriales bacterium]MCE7952719.1 Rieske (2Fe-2S) protein [Chlorobi bacterium CHB7]MDL1886829.1 Rieske (2Fe-2S) protein [Ignavibacteria bacterium CHB1]MEB2330261.1 Rieske (2Fe-2S) protein [Ignavibacteriaceae bacterium]OQY77860.1
MKEKNQEIFSETWKDDFPIQQQEAVHVSRREFAKFLGLLSGTLALGNAGIIIKSILFPSQKLKGEHFVCNQNEVPAGGMKQFELQLDKTIPYILIHLKDGQWRAFEQKCTHLSCAVRYVPEMDKIQCPCHNGYFDARSGVVLQGPPPRPLPRLDVILKDGKVFVAEMKNKT